MKESGENYLETILLLRKKTGAVRSIDIANELDYAKPSVSRAMSILKSAGYVTMQKDGELLLTEMGLKKANEIYERHLLITAFLVKTLNIDDETAAKDACRIEHVISEETFSAIKEFAEKAEQS